MKTSSVIIVLIIGIVIGYVIRMTVHTHPPTEGENPDEKTEETTTIDKDKAQGLVTNNMSMSNYIYLDDVTLMQINNLLIEHHEGSATLLYFGAEEESNTYDLLVAKRMEDPGQSADGDNYYLIDSSEDKVKICPPMCDVASPLEVKNVACESFPLPTEASDSTSVEEEDDDDDQD